MKEKRQTENSSKKKVNGFILQRLVYIFHYFYSIIFPVHINTVRMFIHHRLILFHYATFALGQHTLKGDMIHLFALPSGLLPVPDIIFCYFPY